MFTDETRNKIEDAILNYCEGKTHVEFNINDMDKIINEIEVVVKKLTIPIVVGRIKQCCETTKEINMTLERSAKYCTSCGTEIK